MSVKKVIIMGAAGRDFHNFNVYFRDNSDYKVVAFTATQIPDIDGRKYPADLAGKLYPAGIAIYAEQELLELINKYEADEVYFSYSDVPHEYVMHLASQVNAAGATFVLMGTKATMLKSKVPVIAICAIRTGCGKSQTTRRVSEILKKMGKKVVAIRHPMPYGDLSQQRVQRFATLEDMDRHKCTIEEREEYEPHVMAGNVIYAGVDYADILAQAEQEADVILWDGGNNDTCFYHPDLLITVVDPLRPGHEISYYPGETNARMANVIVINKEEVARLEDIDQVRANIQKINPQAILVDAASPIFVENPELIRGKRVLVVEDGPTLTHGEMKYGAGVVAAEKYGAAEIIDPRPWVSGSIKATFEKYPGIGRLLPAMGYGDKQIHDLEETINAIPADTVIVATPIDLTRIIKIDKPSLRVKYELQEIGKPTLEDIIAEMKF
jgi:predicted GTPase